MIAATLLLRSESDEVWVRMPFTVDCINRRWHTLCHQKGCDYQHFRRKRVRKPIKCPGAKFNLAITSSVCDLQHRAPLSSPTKKTALKIHNRQLTAPAAHSKRLYRKCSGICLRRLPFKISVQSLNTSVFWFLFIEADDVVAANHPRSARIHPPDRIFANDTRLSPINGSPSPCWQGGATPPLEASY